MAEKKALWRTINFENLLEVVSILDDLNNFNILPEGKHSTYYRQCLTPERIMEYAEEIADNDEIWNKIPEDWEIKFSDEKRKNFESIIRIIFPEGSVNIEECMRQSRDELRKRLRLLITLCDQNVGR